MKPLSLPQIERLRWHLFPEIRVASPEQGSLLPGDVPNLIRVMDVEQERLARGLGDGHRVIHGVAGSGKTMILVYRCAHLAKLLSKPILVLCYNKTLAERLATVSNARDGGSACSCPQLPRLVPRSACALPLCHAPRDD